MRRTLIFLVLVGFFLYLPSLFGPFLWDDEDFVYANKYVAEFRVDKFFTDSQTAGRGKLSNYYRPIPQIAYASIHSAFGFNPFWYHLLNVLVHICAACAIFYFFYLLLSKKSAGDGETGPLSANESDSNPKGSRTAYEHIGMVEPAKPALLIALFFLIHPIQTEAVSYISGLSDGLYVLFGFLSLIFFMLKDERKNMIPLSIFFFTLSILSKETGLVFLPLLILLKMIQQFNNVTMKQLKISLKSLIPFVLCTLLYLWYHFTYINNLDIKSAWGNNPYANSIVIRLLTFVQNLFLYVQLLVFPRDLFMERDYTINVQTQILNPALVIFVLVNILIIFVIWKLRNSLEIRNLKLVIFAYLAFFVSFTPYTGIVLINGIFYEHFLYLPLVFFFAFITLSAVELSRILKISFPRPLTSLTLLTLLLLFAFRNISRQFEWNDSIRFYKQTLSHAPKSIRIINGLGMTYAERGDLDSSIREYQLAIRFNPAVPNIYHNLANAYAAKGDIKKAEENYLKALEVDPNFLFSAQSLATLYQQTNQKEKLRKFLEKYPH